jgi:hypothetical protein
VKRRLGHRSSLQKNLRASSRILTGRPSQGRSATVRRYRLCSLEERLLQLGHREEAGRHGVLSEPFPLLAKTDQLHFRTVRNQRASVHPYRSTPDHAPSPKVRRIENELTGTRIDCSPVPVVVNAFEDIDTSQIHPELADMFRQGNCEALLSVGQ